MGKKLIKCKSCKNEIAITAKTCPQCGAPNKASSAAYGGCLVIFGILMVIGMIGNHFEEKEKAEAEKVATERQRKHQAMLAEKEKKRRAALTPEQREAEDKAKAEAKRKADEIRRAEAAKKKAQEEAAAAQIKIAGKKPIASAWDGCTPEVKKYLEANLNDADSLEIVECSNVVYQKISGIGMWRQRVKYRAKNGFGGTILTNQVFSIMQGKVVAVDKYK